MAWQYLWTQDRLFVLDRDWTGGVPIELIHARLNMLDGNALTRAAVNHMAARRNLRRPPGFLSEIRRIARQRSAPAVIVPATPKPAQRPHFPASRFSMLGGTSLTRVIIRKDL
jgi:hypothetical protein